MKNLHFLILLFTGILLITSCKKDKQIFDDIDHPHEHLHRRTCSMHDHMNRLMSQPGYDAFHEDKFRKLKKYQGRKNALASNAVLPVAVHFQGVSNPDVACLRDLAKRQIDILNADYRGENSDISEWTNGSSSSFPGINYGRGGFKFCIADKNHPSGYNLSDGDPAVTVNTTQGDNDAQWSGYLNIFVQFNTGVLGYSPLGGAGNGDGVVVDASAFSTGGGCGDIRPNAPYNLGRTLTHEVGHYLLLDHIWGGGCGSDDEVSDTPDSNEPYYDCPNLGESSCGSTDMHMNYMDYTNDACMYMFSEGQVTRSTNYIASSLQALVDKAAQVCSESNDGGDNGDDNSGDDGGNNDNDNGGDDNGGGDDSDNGDTGGDDGSDDDTTVDGCGAPINIELSSADATNALLTWSTVEGAQRYRVRFRPVGASSWYTTTSDESTIELAALAPETEYQIEVRAICTDENSPWSETGTFRTGNHGCPASGTCTETPIFLALVLDEYGSETTWSVIDANGSAVYTSEAYEDGNNGQEVNEELCLEDGCYTFVMEDTFGDGICCDWGDGYFQLLNEDGSVIADSDGQFGDFIEIDFCVNVSARGKSKRSKIRKEPKDSFDKARSLAK